MHFDYNLVVIVIVSIGIVGVFAYNHRHNKLEKRKHKFELDSDQYSVLIYHLNLCIDQYFENLVKPKITKLRKEIDINPDSPTQNINRYRELVNEEIKKSVSTFINDYTTEHIRSNLLNYFSYDGLILYIYTKIQHQNY